jgi:4-hydroxyphenylpyruvate dioxygenase
VCAYVCLFGFVSPLAGLSTNLILPLKSEVCLLGSWEYCYNSHTGSEQSYTSALDEAKNFFSSLPLVLHNPRSFTPHPPRCLFLITFIKSAFTMVVTNNRERDARRLAEEARKRFLPSIATMSLGKAGLHSLPKKLEVAASTGFQGVELFWDDLEAYASSLHAEYENNASTYAIPLVVLASQKVRLLCDALGLGIVSVQPFRNFDGLIDSNLRNERIEEFKIWLLVADELSAEFIGVPATIQPNPATHTGDLNVIARDLSTLAELARPYNVRIAYENLCFGAHTRSWTRAWDAVTRVDNSAGVSFLADTFNLCGDQFADPSMPGGKTLKAEYKLSQSLERFAETLPGSGISFLQLADAELMTPPISSKHPWMDGCLNAKMAWSRNARLFPFERRGYLPILDAVEAVVRTGWSGWVSMEVFSRTTAKEGEATIWEHADRAWTSWKKLAAAMRWPVRPTKSSKRYRRLPESGTTRTA